MFSFYGDELLPTFSQILEKKWVYTGAVRGLCIDFKKADHSVRKEVLYKVFIEFGIL
jgi:hypothetical protein